MLAGCTAKKEVAKDPFFEKWRVMAQEKQGTSPKARERVLDLPKKEHDAELKAAAEAEAKQKAVEKILPKTLVTLKMRNTDVNIILRALARAANQNILIKDGLEAKYYIS
jgi:type IV pilus assembly protein PilQ